MRAMYSLLRKIKKLSLPVDMQIDLFNKTVKPILLYGCEVCGFGNNGMLESIQLKFLKCILKLKKSTPSNMVYGETGVYPLKIDIETRMIQFWSKTIQITPNTLLSDVYYSMYDIYQRVDRNQTVFNWYKHVKDILIKCGLINIWNNHFSPNPNWLKLSVKQKLKDLFVNSWFSDIENNHGLMTYKLFKKKFGFENYLIKIPRALMHYLLKFRTNNHRLPIERGRWANTDLRDRICDLCLENIGDEYRYLFECKTFSEERKSLIPVKYTINHNVIKFDSLLNSSSTQKLLRLCKFIKVVFSRL